MIFCFLILWATQPTSSNEFGSCDHLCKFGTCVSGCDGIFSTSCDVCNCPFGWQGKYCEIQAFQHIITTIFCVYFIVFFSFCCYCLCSAKYRQKRTVSQQHLPQFDLHQPAPELVPNIDYSSHVPQQLAPLDHNGVESFARPSWDHYIIPVTRLTPPTPPLSIARLSDEIYEDGFTTNI